MPKLRCGIIGVGGYGRLILAELGRSPQYEIIAIADQDRELADDLAQQYEAQAYDDYRSLIVQEKLDILFLALPTHLCDECIQLAVKEKVHILKEAPLARTLPEATEWVKAMSKAGLKFHVSAPKRFAPGYLAARQILQDQTLGDIYLVRGESFFCFPDSFEWRGDPVLAGGGVLLEHAYHLIDQFLWNIGVPERVFCLQSSKCNKRSLPPYRTEDTVVLNMKFPDDIMANLITSWMTAPARERIYIHGTASHLEAHTNLLRLYDIDGNITKEETFTVDESWLVNQQLRHFADSLFDPEIKPLSTAKEHLLNVAAIESAYLSARTKMPESLKFYSAPLDFK
jgi:predicted dehydrogenase